MTRGGELHIFKKGTFTKDYISFATPGYQLLNSPSAGAMLRVTTRISPWYQWTYYEIEAFSLTVYSWKLSRSRSDLSEAANTVINQIVDSNIDLWEGYYRTIGQDNDACFHYPIFDELPSFIELPGPCPDAIRGVSDFNVDAVSKNTILINTALYTFLKILLGILIHLNKFYYRWVTLIMDCFR